MAGLIQLVRHDPPQAGGALLIFSLVYGMLHAVGPGHGKVVIATYLATHPARLKLSLYMTLGAALLQGAVAIALVTGVVFILVRSSRYLHQGEFWLERGSYLLMALLGLLLCYRAAARWLSATRRRRHHPAGCGCGHYHLPDEHQLQSADGWRTRLAVVMAMGVRPCSGAVLILLFAKVLGVYVWGMAAAALMALGTALTLVLIALLVFYGRRLAEKLALRSGTGPVAGMVWASLSFMGGALLMLAGVVLYISALPLPMGGVGPFGR